MAKTDATTSPPREPRKKRKDATLLEPWRPGESGNPAGRPKGSKHLFGEAFWRDLSVEWHRRGAKVLQELDDLEFARIAAQKAPTVIEAEVDVRVTGWLSVLRGADGDGPS